MHGLKKAQIILIATIVALIVLSLFFISVGLLSYAIPFILAVPSSYVIYLAATASPKEGRVVKKKVEKVTIEGKLAYGILKDGIYLKLKRGLLRDGVLDLGDREYVVKGFEPYILVVRKLGRTVGYPVFLLHPDLNAVYKFEEPNVKEAAKEAIEAKIRPIMQNPVVIKHYISSNIVQKLVQKLQASKMEIAMALLTGVGLAYFIEFFILPLMGYRIIIGGG